MRPALLAPAAALLFSATTLAAEAEAPLVRDLDPAMNARLNAREGIEFFAGVDRVLGLGPDAPGQTGWGLSAGAYVVPDNRGNPGWQTRWGGAFTYFGTSGSETIRGRDTDISVDAAYITLEYGGTTRFARDWEAGVMFGLGTGFLVGASDDGSSVDTNVNWDWVLRAKPMLIWHANRSVHVYGAYKLDLVSPFYNTNLIGYRSATLLKSSVELGVTWRF